MASQSRSNFDKPSSLHDPSQDTSTTGACLPTEQGSLPNDAKTSSTRNPYPDSSTVEESSPDEKLPSTNEVNWESDNDPQNPQYWKPSLKWRNLGVISAMSFATPLTSTMFAPAVHLLPSHWHLSSTTSTLVVSIFVLGFAIGPLIVAPLSEIYGRRPAYVLSMLLFLIFTIACAVSTSLPMLIVFRFLAGSVGSTAMTLGSATVGDVLPPDRRGGSMALMAMGPLLGPVLGPIIGGYLGQAEGWRWIFWVQAILAGVLFLLGLICLRETYPIVILEHKARALRKETGNPHLRSALHDGLAPAERIKLSIVRPLHLLFTEPILFILSVYVAFLFGCLYLFLTTFPRVFTSQYGFSTKNTGLTYIGLGVGMFFGMGLAGKGSDVIFRALVKRNEGKEEPEYRIPPLVVSAPLVATAFFWYGWSAEGKTHWIVPILGTVVFGIGQMPAFMSVNMYLVHSYGRYAASAIAASKVLQSVGGAFLPLAGEPMFDRLGLGWGNSVLAFIALVFAPVPWILFVYGKRLREMTKAKG